MSTVPHDFQAAVAAMIVTSASVAGESHGTASLDRTGATAEVEPVRVIPTDEESLIARASAGLIARTRSGSDRDS